MHRDRVILSVAGTGRNTVAGPASFVWLLVLGLFAPASVWSAIEISGIIATDTTLEGGATYHVTGSLTVAASATLTIPAGTVLKAGPGRGIIVDGELIANGTAEEPVFFTELRDSSVGEDLDPVNDPAPGGWQGISVLDGASANLHQVRIRYAGPSSLFPQAVVKSGSGTLSLTDSVIELANQLGLRLTNTDGDHVITGNTIQQVNGDGLHINNASGSLTISGNSLINNNANGLHIRPPALLAGISGNTITGNAADAVRLAPNASGSVIEADNVLDGPVRIEGGSLSVDADWVNVWTYALAGSLTVAADRSLSLAPGTVVKGGGSHALVVHGTLSAQGSADQPVHFTEHRDASVGHWAAAGDPAPGGWYGLDIRDGASANLHQVRIRYAGPSSLFPQAVVKSGSGTLSLTDSVIELGNRDGIVIQNTDADHLVSRNIIRLLNGDAIRIINAQGMVTLDNNSLVENSRHGLFIVSSGVAESGVRNENVIQIQHNRINANQLGGIRLQDSVADISNNWLNDHANVGIHLSGPLSSPVIRSNFIGGNIGGIDASGEANPIIGGAREDGN